MRLARLFLHHLGERALETRFRRDLCLSQRVAVADLQHRRVDAGGGCLVKLCETRELLAKPVDETSDFWALGCITHELLAGATPFAAPDQDITTLVKNILHNPIVLAQTSTIQAPEEAFLLALLTRDPAARLGARPHGHEGVLAHPWLCSISAASLLAKEVVPPAVPLPPGLRGGSVRQTAVQARQPAVSVLDSESESPVSIRACIM